MAKNFAPKGVLELLVLRILGMNKDMNEDGMYGNEIISFISKMTHGEMKPSPGTIYPLLKKLDERGLLKCVKVNKKRKNYIMTEKGRQELKKHDKQMIGLKKKWINFLLKDSHTSKWKKENISLPHLSPMPSIHALLSQSKTLSEELEQNFRLCIKFSEIIKKTKSKKAIERFENYLKVFNIELEMLCNELKNVKPKNRRRLK